jgi:hypothetical protein
MLSKDMFLVAATQTATKVFDGFSRNIINVRGNECNADMIGGGKTANENMIFSKLIEL